MHPARVIYRRIQGFLEIADDNHHLEDLGPPDGSLVPKESPLAFFLIARDHYREFIQGNVDPWVEDLETNRLVTILMCTMPIFARYVDQSANR